MDGRFADLRRAAEDVRARVSCETLLVQHGFAVVPAASTPTSRKFKRGEDVVVTLHGGLGWFRPLAVGERGKGDVIALAQQLLGLDFRAALHALGETAGMARGAPAVHARPARHVPPTIDAPGLWRSRRAPWRGSAGWRYLTEARGISERVLAEAVRADVLREGVRGTVHALHRDADGAPSGWEMRGPEWKGFTKGGRKGLFVFAPWREPTRLAVTEAFIDALSMADIEDLRCDSAWASVDGGFGAPTEMALRSWLSGAAPGVQVVVATDADRGGAIIADRVGAIVAELNLPFHRLLPPEGSRDWNEALRLRGQFMLSRA